MKIPFVKNIDLVRFICKEKVLHFTENTNFAGKRVDYIQVSLAGNNPEYGNSIDLQIGIEIKSLRGWLMEDPILDIFVYLKSIQRDIALAVPITEYINEINCNIKRVGSILDLKNCYLKLSNNSIDDTVILFYVFYNSDFKHYDKLRFAYTKQIKVPSDFACHENRNIRLINVKKE